MSKLTKEQWDQIAQELSYPFGSVEMVIDGLNVKWRVEKYKNLRWVIFPYVNGSFQWKWCSEDSLERRLLCRPREIFLFSKSEREKYQKRFGKRAFAQSALSKSMMVYQPIFSSIRVLKAHLNKVATSIELISVGYRTAVKPALADEQGVSL